MKERKTIVPYSPAVFEQEYRFPYTNEFILLSFEGHHKPFEVVYEQDSGCRMTPQTSGKSERGFFTFLRNKITSLYE